MTKFYPKPQIFYQVKSSNNKAAQVCPTFLLINQHLPLDTPASIHQQTCKQNQLTAQPGHEFFNSRFIINISESFSSIMLPVRTRPSSKLNNNHFIQLPYRQHPISHNPLLLNMNFPQANSLPPVRSKHPTKKLFSVTFNRNYKTAPRREKQKTSNQNKTLHKLMKTKA
jgi:hypothetical protein